MNSVPTIPKDYILRLQQVVDESWRIFQSQFLHGRHPVTTEAPFQHHFANVLSSVGALYCTSREDIFHVDLETKVPDVKGKNKYLDITCSFPLENVSCAIELKFKTAKQGAQDHGRIDAYVDIEALELVTNSGFDFGRFFMITNSKTYLHVSTMGVGTVFCLHDGYTIPANEEFNYPTCHGREHVVTTFKQSHTLSWQQAAEWYFLAVNIGDNPSFGATE